MHSIADTHSLLPGCIEKASSSVKGTITFTISLGLEEADGEGLEIFDADWPAPGCHGGDTALN